MYQIITDTINGKITISDSWTTSVSGTYSAPSFSNIGDEFVVSFIELEGIDKFKSFTYSATNITENRNLTSEYRISRDARKWTQWFPLETTINNFPPFTPTDKMYFDLKIKRTGTSEIGDIKLLNYTLNGSLDRNILTGDKPFIVSNGSQVLVKPPYIYKAFKLTDIEVLSSNNLDLNIKYRYSQDYGRTVTEWEHFTKENVTTARINPIRFFQVEYLLETSSTTPIKVWDINIIGDLQNVTLDYKKTNLYGVRENCNCLKLGLVNHESNANQFNTSVGSNMLMPTEKTELYRLTEEEKNKLFNPYKLNEAQNLLNKLSVEANEMFGHEVIYFLTDPDRKGIDHTFHEYQLYNIVCNESLKVSVENNKFPDNQIQFNQFDLSLFETFEVHIPKETFKLKFGVEKRPSKEDFLWFCEINRLFTIEHAQEFRGFNNMATYYRVMLKKYNQKSNVIPVNDSMADKVKDLVKNSTLEELFPNFMEEDKSSVSNKEQNTPLTLDTLRLEINALIEKETIFNADTIISKSNYDLSSVSAGSDAVVYRNMKKEILKSDNFCYISWFKLNDWSNNNEYTLFDYYNNSENQGIKFIISDGKFVTRFNNTDTELLLNKGLDSDVWYSCLVNINQRQRKIQKYIYKRDVEDEEEAEYLNSTKLQLLYKKEFIIEPQESIIDNSTAKLIGADLSITNIRLFSDVISEKEHNKILNQNIIRDDSSYLIFADNANEKIVLPNFPLSQIPPNSVGFAKKR